MLAIEAAVSLMIPGDGSGDDNAADNLDALPFIQKMIEMDAGDDGSDAPSRDTSDNDVKDVGCPPARQSPLYSPMSPASLIESEQKLAADLEATFENVCQLSPPAADDTM